ncbi:hypothetical protein C8R44DRAFT_944780 [Mycena epipterygia]|nr:hypothetical protein C8R44DRAFT_944780 [Mycena epipterygia]
MTTTFCPNCGSDLVQEDTHFWRRSTEARRTYLRNRLSGLTVLIAALTVERQSLQAESDSIIYPVLSLPTEITTEVLKNCLPTDSLPYPSPSTAPLLLTQICRQWRYVALHTHDLWRSLLFENDASVEMLKLWLSRAGDLPLEYTLRCEDPSRAGALVEASMLHSHHWQDISLRLPLESFPKLDTRHSSLPMLRTISLDIKEVGEVAQDLITIQDAPLLRNVHIFSLPYLKFSVPWPQLTTLTLCHWVDLEECIALLRECSQLVHLVVSVWNSPTATPDASPITLPLLETLTSNEGDQSILNYLTLPRLERLGIETHDLNVLSSFIHRSACTLHFLWLSVTGIGDPLDSFLRAAPSSVHELQLDGNLRVCCNALQHVDVLPQLKTLHIRNFSAVLVDDFDDVLPVLHARAYSSGGPLLHSFVLETSPHWLFGQPQHMPKSSTMAQLLALAADGLKIKLTSMSETGETQVILDSCAP